jgi:hypothetical protein
MVIVPEGNFLSNLIATSCPRTRPLLKNGDNTLILKPKATNTYTYGGANYFRKSLGSTMMYIDFTPHMMTSEELIRNCKSSIFSSLMSHYNDKVVHESMDKFSSYTPHKTIIKNRLNELYKDTALIIFKHFYFTNKEKMTDFNSTKYWDVINIDPISKEGRKCVDNSWRVIFKHNQTREYRTTNSDIKRFPFFDYMIYEDYNEIKYFLENRYGSNLDFDFIDRSLKDYYKIRVEPYLK